MEQLQLENIRLKYGGHQTREDGLCAMEAVAYFAGEPHSDKPKCTCPVLAAFVRNLNDGMDDETRQLLKPYILRLINTNDSSKELERTKLLAWAAVTEFAPLALEKAGLKDHANKLRNLPKYDWYAARYAANATWAAAANAAWAATWAAATNATANAAWAATAANAAASWDLALAALDRALEIK
jgi:hypothetical protein